MLQYLQGTDNLSDFRLRIEVRFSKFYKKNTEHPNQNPKKGAFFSDFEKNNSWKNKNGRQDPWSICPR